MNQYLILITILVNDKIKYKSFNIHSGCPMKACQLAVKLMHDSGSEYEAFHVDIAEINEMAEPLNLDAMEDF